MKVALVFALGACAVGEEAPTWPGAIAPVWPTQFSAPVTGWDNATSPTNFTGTMHYDWVNNLMRYDSTPVHAGSELAAKPLPNSSRVWIAEPRPQQDYLAHVKPVIYQFNWDTGSCVTFSLPGLAIERPYSFTHVNATHKAREMVDGRWTDYWYYWFDADTPMGHVAEPFNLWQDIYHNWPVMVYGPLSPPDMTEWGATVWGTLNVGEPDHEKLTGLDFSKCKGFPPGSIANIRTAHQFIHADRAIQRMNLAQSPTMV